MNTKNQIKKFREHEYKVELEKLEKKVLPLLIEKINLLKSLEVESIEEFESKLNKRSGFLNAEVSAKAYNLEAQYSRLHELKRLINGKLTKDDLDSSNKLKNSFKEELKQGYIIYYSAKEINQRKKMQKVMDAYNDLSLDSKQRLIIDLNYKMQFNPFIRH